MPSLTRDGGNSSEHFSWPVRVYYEDTDAGGIVYYANYLRFMERARTEYLRSVGVEQDAWLARQGLQFVVRRVAVDYRKPARFNDALRVSVRVDTVRRASVVFGQAVRHVEQPDALVTASVQVACVDAETGRPTPIPKMLTEAMQGER
ncbi:MAG: tol-pal system-associated acyl-CoA thioesterase [Pseudomonadota bacterium]